MRCPSCGTENAPDSRFCGGCGALLARSQVAPTAKIPDDAPMPMPAPAAPQPQYSTLPPQMPSPFAAAPVPGTPVPSGTVQRPRAPVAPIAPSAPRPTPSVSDESLAERPRGRRWGLIAFILLVDLGLAGAGAWMLNESRGADAAAPPPAESSK